MARVFRKQLVSKNQYFLGLNFADSLPRKKSAYQNIMPFEMEFTLTTSPVCEWRRSPGMMSSREYTEQA
jgi:hypothetical protein